MGTTQRFEFAKRRYDEWETFKKYNNIMGIPPKRVVFHMTSVIYDCVSFGENVYVGPHSVIGHPGFGFGFDEEGVPLRIGHTGGVFIGDGVEIGCMVTICQGTVENTVIGDNTKIDDFAHIAHNVVLGKCVVIPGKVSIGGSAVIGDYAYLGQGCIIKNKVKVGDHCFIGAGAVVVKDTEPYGVYAGVPAKLIRTRRLEEDKYTTKEED